MNTYLAYIPREVGEFGKVEESCIDKQKDTYMSNNLRSGDVWLCTDGSACSEISQLYM